AAESRTRSCSCPTVRRMTWTETGTAGLFTCCGLETCTARARSLFTEPPEESEDGAFCPVPEGPNGFNNEQEYPHVRFKETSATGICPARDSHRHRGADDWTAGGVGDLRHGPQQHYLGAERQHRPSEGGRSGGDHLHRAPNRSAHV